MSTSPDTSRPPKRRRAATVVIGPDGFVLTPREVLEFRTARRNGTKLD